jgi:hypothetical protein
MQSKVLVDETLGVVRVSHWDHEYGTAVLGLKHVSRTGHIVTRSARLAGRSEHAIPVAEVGAVVVSRVPRIRRAVRVVCVIAWSRRVHASIWGTVFVVRRLLRPGAVSGSSCLGTRSCNNLCDLADTRYSLCTVDALSIGEQLLLRYGHCMRVKGSVTSKP